MGEKEHGDATFLKTGAELCDDLEEELLDICGYGIFLSRRLRILRDKLSSLEGDIGGLRDRAEACK